MADNNCLSKSRLPPQHASASSGDWKKYVLIVTAHVYSSASFSQKRAGLISQPNLIKHGLFSQPDHIHQAIVIDRHPIASFRLNSVELIAAYLQFL